MPHSQKRYETAPPLEAPAHQTAGGLETHRQEQAIHQGLLLLQELQLIGHILNLLDILV